MCRNGRLLDVPTTVATLYSTMHNTDISQAHFRTSSDIFVTYNDIHPYLLPTHSPIPYETDQHYSNLLHSYLWPHSFPTRTVLLVLPASNLSSLFYKYLEYHCTVLFDLCGHNFVVVKHGQAYLH